MSNVDKESVAREQRKKRLNVNGRKSGENRCGAQFRKKQKKKTSPSFTSQYFALLHIQ